MCFLKPLKVCQIKGSQVLLENGTEAVYDKKIGLLKTNDEVLVYGNLIIQRINTQNEKTKPTV